LVNNEEITIKNLYCPPSGNIDSCEKIFESQGKTHMVGDFNAHNTLRDAPAQINEAIKSKNISTKNTLTFMNTGTPTHFQINTTPSAIDRTISSANIPPKLNWYVHNYILGSDHQPIIIIYNEAPQFEDPLFPAENSPKQIGKPFQTSAHPTLPHPLSPYQTP
jgi:hypothetical protein